MEVLVTPPSYGNQAEVAEGLRKAFKEIPGLKREDVFIVSSYPEVFSGHCGNIKSLRHRSYGTGTFTPLLSSAHHYIDSLSSQHRPEIVEAALDDCLQELGLEYLDVSREIIFNGHS